MRVRVTIPDPLLAALDAIGRRNGRSRSELIRRAVREHVRHAAALDDAFGLWASQTLDGARHQRAMRAEWTSRT